MAIDPERDPQADQARRFPASRLRPRGTGQAPTPGPGPGPAGSWFGPRSFGGGRFQVYGCSPGCLVVSLLVSVVLTLLLNALF